MVKILLLLLLSIPLMSKADMSVREEIDIITSAMSEIKQTNNHPHSDKLKLLEQSKKDRLELLYLNNLDDYVIVNLSSQKLTLVENEYSVGSQQIIIGKDSKETPTFSDKLRYIVLNPYWNVPSEVSITDIIPSIRNHPHLIESYGFEMLENATNRKVKFNTEVDLRRYRIRQKPNEFNALGKMKFMFNPVPNRNIYFHDVGNRKYSSGSISLEDPIKFSEYLMKGKSYTASKGDDVWIELPEPVDVHIVDWGVYVDSANNLIVNGTTLEKFLPPNLTESEIIEF